MSHPTLEPPLNLVKPSAPFEATVLENRDLTPDSADDVRHVVLDLSGSGLRYLDGQALGVIPPGQDAAGKPHRLRQYSIASPRGGDDGDDRTVSLTVKRVVYADEAGETVRGVCSNHLNDAQPGDKVRVCGPFGRHFMMPAEPVGPLLLIATGTGIAPFRGFLRQRARTGPATPAILVFGVRTTADLLYADELRGLLTGPEDQLLLAISREQTNAAGGRMYVGDRLVELGDTLAPLLREQRLHVYQCGLKGMETGVEAACEALLAPHGLTFSGLKPELVKARRWLVDTY
ncbi:MAG: FAD-binding oxidoreductase [Candidatus Sericytochromatia bacterium]|nr:FAD-binding oxidoreductase [Candidatus Sericytochromatia bacterium]